MPLPWMTGPLLAMAACNFAGAELRSPPGARAVGQIIIGTALGLYFTPVVGREVSAHWWLLLAAAAVAIFLGVLGGWVLSRASGVDAKTAFFASVPGGACGDGDPRGALPRTRRSHRARAIAARAHRGDRGAVRDDLFRRARRRHLRASRGAAALAGSRQPACRGIGGGPAAQPAARAERLFLRAARDDDRAHGERRGALVLARRRLPARRRCCLAAR
jgi:hypothetical protein